MGLGGLLARLTAIALVLALLAAGAGYLLPRDRTIESKTVVLGPPDKVFDLVTDVRGYERWRDNVSALRIDEGSEPLTWSEKESGWPMNFRVVKRERPKLERDKTSPDKLLWSNGVFEVEFESPSGFSGRRTYLFEPTDTGDRTQLTRTDEFVIPNPLRRVYSYLGVNLKRMIDAQLQDLGHEFVGTPFDTPSNGTPQAEPSASSPPGGGHPSASPQMAPSPTAATASATGPAPAVPASTPPASTPSATAVRPSGATPSSTGRPSLPAPSGSASATPSRI
jgi:hypothetical protein